MRKLLILVTLLFAVQQVRAVEIFNQPFVYFLKARAIPNNAQCLDTAYWWLKPTVSVPVLQLRRSNSANTKLDVSTMASAGGGLTYQRTVVQDGKNYSTISLSIIELLAANPGATGINPDFAAGILCGMFNNLLQGGIGYDFGNVPSGHRWFLMLSFGVNLTNN
jgi:hypothetical protein